MNEKAASAQQKALQERKRGHFDKAVKRLEQAIAQFPDELDLYLDAVDACLEGGEVMQATNFLKTAQEKFTKDKDRVAEFVKDKLLAVHDPALARYVVENAVKRRDLDGALEHLEQIPDHVARDLLARTKTKKQSLKSASHGGYSLRAEIFTNDLLSALLSIRLGSLKDGMTALVEIIDEKPVETKMLQPFLAGLESKQPKVGRIRYAHGIALWAGGNEVDCISRVVEAARFDSTMIPTCIDRLQSLRDKTKYKPKVERALAEVLLLKDDFDAAALVLRGYLADNKDSAREVIMILKPFIDPAHSVNACVWLAVDAALTLDQSVAAMEILRPMYVSGKCTPDIYAHLEGTSKESVFTIEVMLFHASLALELKDFPRAVDILNAVVTASPQDVHAVVGLADKHRTSHPGLEELCRKHMQAEVVEAIAEGEDFQNFDHNEFSLHRDAKADGIERSSSAPRPQSPTAQGEKPASRFAEERTKHTEKQSFTESRELSFDDDGTPDAPSVEEPIEQPVAETDDDGFETSRDLRLSSTRDAKSAEKPRERPLERLIDQEIEKEIKKEIEQPSEKLAAPAVTPASAPASQARQAVKLRPSAEPTIGESHVTNVARRLGLVGAAAFFHIDDEEPESVVESSPPVDETPPRAEAPPSRAPIDAAAYAHVSTVPEPTPAIAPTPAVAAVPKPVAVPKPPAIEPEPVVAQEPVAAAVPVATPPSVIERIERALDDGRADELHDLLAFEPKDDAERFAQRFYEAEYHTLCSRPLPALAILTKLGESSLTDEQKQRVWLKTAVCQRSMNDFAGANDTLKRLVTAFPGRAEYERLERHNYEQFLGNQANDVAVLQKTTSLD